MLTKLIVMLTGSSFVESVRAATYLPGERRRDNPPTVFWRRSRRRLHLAACEVLEHS
jgi:hypothetical protein